MSARRLVAAIALVSACAGSTKAPRHLRLALDAQHANLTRCYAQALAKDPTTAGTMTVVVRVPTTGRVDHVAFERGANKLLSTCVRNALMGLETRKPDAALRIQYVVKFAPAVTAAR